MRFSVDLSEIVAAMPRIKQQLATAAVAHIKAKIRMGMPPPLKKPRRDGSTSTPLFHRGAHLWPSIQSSVSRTSFSIGSNFVGARRLNYGGGGVAARQYMRVDSDLLTKWRNIWLSYGTNP